MTERALQEREYWDAAAKSDDLRNQWICDKNVTDKQCLDAILPHLKHHRILEIGCGPGRLTSRIATSSSHGCCNLHGIDVSQNMVQLAADNTPYKVYSQYKVCDGRSIPDFKCCEAFDSVYSMATFQHIDEDGVRAYIREAYRVLVPGGVFRFQYVEGTEQEPFSRHYDEGSMVTWLKEVGFIVEAIDRGLIFPQWTWITAVKP